MDHHHHYGLLTIGFALAIIAVLAGFLTFHAPITANVVAVGGQITHMDLNVGSSNILWVGIFGNVSSTGSNGSQEFSSGELIAINLSFNGSISNNTYVALSNSNNVTWSNLSPASLAQVNNYMGVLSSNAYSAENTLTFKHNFSLSSITYEVWSAQTNSLNGSYITGAFTDGSALIFITKLVDYAYGFMNTATDYQVLFPISENATANVTFTIFNDGALPIPGILACNVSANLSAKVASDNVSIDVYWDPVLGAINYELLYIDGSTNGFMNFSSSTSIALGSNTSWTDINPSNERYYRVRVTGNSGSCIVDETAGTIVVNVSPEFNLLSTPFISEDNTVNEVLRPINGFYNEVYEFDNTGKIYKYYIVVGNTIFRTFNTINPTKTYWIKTFDNSTLRFAGRTNEAVNESISPDFNLMGFPAISNNASDDSLNYIFTSVLGNFSEVYEFDNDAKVYEYYIVVGNTVFRTFNTIKPAKAYWIKTNVSEQLVYAND